MTRLSQALAFGFLFGATLYAEYGCMDTSYHTAQLNDPKKYYIVTGADGGPCSCPCSKYCAQYKCSLARGRCPVCGHYRIPRPYIIVTASKESQELRPATSIDRYKMPLMRKKIAGKRSDKPQN
jgi:hypothetical protein